VVERTGAFDAIEHQATAWQLVLGPDQTVALYATFPISTFHPQQISEELPPHLSECLHSSYVEAAWNDRHGRFSATVRIVAPPSEFELKSLPADRLAHRHRSSVAVAAHLPVGVLVANRVRHVLDHGGEKRLAGPPRREVRHAIFLARLRSTGSCLRVPQRAEQSPAKQIDTLTACDRASDRQQAQPQQRAVQLFDQPVGRLWRGRGAASE
jgi:hypothetical protein